MRTHSPLSPAVSVTLLLAFLTVVVFPASVATQVRERTMFVSAVDGDGEPVEGLGPEAFDIREDGRRREILRVVPADDPIDIVLLLDNSTAASAEITTMREAVSAFITLMTPDHRIAMIGLAQRPTVIVDYTADTKRLSDGVGRLFAMPQSGMTLLDAVAESARGLERRPASRAAIVAIVTDGVEFTNRYSRDVVRTLVDARAAFHAVTVGRFLHAEEHSLRERSFFLDDGPKQSGGQRIPLLSPHALPQTLERLARELSSQYRVVYARPDTLIPPERVEVAPAREGLTMRGTPARGETGA